MFEDDSRGMVFDSKLMEFERDEKPVESKPEVSLVVSTAMKKRERLNGEDFNERSVLLRMEVLCEIRTLEGSTRQA